MDAQPRHLHTLEKIVAIFALFAVLALTFGFAQGAGNKKKPRGDEYDRAQAAQPEKVFLRSSSVLVQDASNGETLLAKNAGARDAARERQARSQPQMLSSQMPSPKKSRNRPNSSMGVFKYERYRS